MQYSIWIVDSWPEVKGPNAKGHTRCFEEVALALQSAFRELGYEVPIVDSPEKAVGRTIVLGAGVLDRHKNAPMPEDVIIYNFEQVHDDARFFRPNNPYIYFLRRYPVWDYSQNNIAQLKERGVTDVTMCGVGYMPELTCIPKQEAEDIDVLFIGSMQPRRQKIIDELKQRGMRVQVIENMYGKQRDDMIARSKVILNLHIQPANVFEIVRVSYMLANKKCVVSEDGDDKQLEGPYEKAVVFRPYDELVSACLEYVSDSNKRKKQEEAGFQIFSQMSQVPMLQAALEGNEKKHPAVTNAAQQNSTKPALRDVKPILNSARRIFVNIASFRDPEIDATIRNMYAMATHPARVFTGVCLQIDPVKDALCTINNDRPWQIHIRQVPFNESKGANWARAEAQKLWAEEDYVLQIDSHMRFAKGWDEAMIDMLEACPSEKPVLSTYVPRYVPPNKLTACDDHRLRIRVQTFGDEGTPQLIHLSKAVVPLSDTERCGLYPSPFYIANFMFCRAQTLLDVPFDPHIKFWGDEITYSARLWTHGYDVFQPDQLVIWHYWRRDELVKIQPYRRLDTADSKRSVERIKHLLGFEQSNDTMALTEFDQYGLGGERALDELWEFAGIDWQQRTISDLAKEGRWNMAAKGNKKKGAGKGAGSSPSNTTPAKTAEQTPAATTSSQQAKPAPGGLPRIFVQIPSYRDPDCQNTIKDLFDKAMHPERIFVGICWQYKKNEDKHCFQVPYAYPKQVRVKEFDAAESQGVCWARSITQQMWEGEEFTLHIDSHMRFELGWDNTLIEMWEQCQHSKAVLTAYPPAFIPPSTLNEGAFNITAKEFDKDGVLLFHTKQQPTGKDTPTKPMHGAFVGAGMLFAPSSVIKDVPYDPFLFFFGEEATYAARLWTSGYEIFYPQRSVVWHDWDRTKRPTFFTDHPDWVKRNEVAYARARYLLGTELNTDGAIIKQLDKYGLGSERSMLEYQEYCGVDFAMKVISDFAREGDFDPNRSAKLKKEREEKDAANALALRNRTHDGPLPRILVLIPSYRDPDCQNSIKDLFDKANHPERIFVAVCWQYLMDGTDDDCFVVPYPYPDQVREHKVDAIGSRGMCWARWQTQQMWQGEEFVLSMDAHMRFEPGWDDIIIDVWKNCDNPKAMLSVHPPKFDPPDKLSRGYVHGMSAAHFNDEGILMILGKPPYPVDEAPEKPMPGAIIGDGFLFGPSSWIHDVPFDQHLYFFGQEITVAIRLWTNGYDIYHPNKLVMYHDYGRPNRKHHSRDNTDGHERNQRSFARVRHMLGTELSTDPDVLFEIEKYGLGTTRTLAQYEEYSGVDFKKKTIAEFAFEGRYNHYNEGKGMPKLTSKDVLAVKEPLHTKPFKVTRNNTIFINIASYRDPECQHTIKDLFEKANNPGRIYVGVCWQFDPAEDEPCFQVNTRPNQVRVRAVDWRDAEGVCWARYQAQQLWEQEEYVLMIDSHMRFVPGWDDLMIAELNACEAMKPLLSCSPASYTPPNNLSRHLNPTIRRVRPFMPDGNIRCQGEALDYRPEKPLNGAFMVANFVFSRAEVLAEVPYDPFLYFDQEEITYAARLYTHGWDVFSSRQQFLYHFYNDVKAPGGSVRPLHWRDLRQEDEARIRYLKERGLKRFNHMTGYQESTEQDVIQRLDEFGWGRVRTLQQFEEYAGLDFKNKVASEKALRCWFINDLAKYRERPIVIPEIDMQKRAASGQAGGGAVAVAANPVQAQPVVQPAGAQSMQQVGLQAPQAGHFQSGARPAVSLVSMQDNKPQAEVTAKAANANDMPAELTKPAPVTLLEKGDFLPMFEIPDHTGKKVFVERFGGKFALACFLPADDVNFIGTLINQLKEASGKHGLTNVWEWFVLDASIEQTAHIKQQLNVPHLLLADEGRKICQSLGVCQPGDKRVTPTGFVINQNLRIVESFTSTDPVQMAHQMVRQCIEHINAHKARNANPRVISEMAPALIVPDAFTKEMAEKCIKSFRTGHTFEGTVGAEKGKAYRPEAKIRLDHIPPAALTAEIDDKLSRSLFPEIKKVFGIDIKFREQYKVGLYSGDKKGFFIAHRDNFDNPLGYRRYAMTLHLTDDFEGGGLRFPEYGDDVYRPTQGSAIVFSCGTLHEALPVTKGERFVLVGFFHGEEEDKYRRHYALSKGHPINQKDFVPTLRQHPELRLSRAFYEEWKGEHQNQPAAGAANTLIPYGALDVRQQQANLEKTSLTSVGTHTPVKVFESKGAVVLDNFLPENIYKQLHQHMQRADYERINSSKITRAWHIQDGSPLRSQQHAMYYADPTIKPDPGYLNYPSNTVFDPFIEHILAVQPNVQHVIGQKSKDWWHMSVSGWLYPPGTGLAMHEDGSGVYSGAYVYFLNPTWKPHWGGQLLLIDDQSNDNMRKYQKETDRMDVYKDKWLHANRTDSIIMEEGLAQCVFPKGNRIVFIANDAYHMVTRVNEQAGDNVRMSLAGFFVTSKEPIRSNDTDDYG